MVVVETIKVANDLTCVDMDALIVGADNVVIDLNGHRINCVTVVTGYLGSCQGVAATGGATDAEPEDGVNITGRVNVHVVDNAVGGTIQGFDNGININRSQDVKVERITFTGPPGDVTNPRPFSHGVLVRGSSCVGDTQIHIGTGQFKGNEMMNHNQGIAINGSCVSILHNKVHDNDSNGSVPSNGILLNQSSNVVVRENEVVNNGDEVDDFFQDGGITLRNQSRNNHIVNNVVNSNYGDGISVRLGSEANLIDNNTMLFNGGIYSGILYYDAAGRGSGPGNKWNQNNVCVTQNEEVPPGVCGTTEGT
ncbi:MAG: right-handed parallel beta-helix repeat-containing protein [Actinobacteria bacterium]|nr:right-handed parallel beta-helix repeat-containing protein [Actinomycetota bacterium]